MKWIKTTLFTCFLAGSFAQDSWKENSTYFKGKQLYQLDAYVFEDGAFQVSEGAYRFKFDAQGNLNTNLTQQVNYIKVAESERSSGCTYIDTKKNIRYTLADNIIHIEKMFVSKNNEYRSIYLQKQERLIKSVWDQYANTANHSDAGFVLLNDRQLLLYQTYFGISYATHPDLFKPKGINTFCRMVLIDLENYSVTYHYPLIDVFQSELGNKKKEVLERYDFNCLGLNEKGELVFMLAKSKFDNRDSPIFSLSDIKGIDYTKTSVDVWTVNTTNFSQKHVYTSVFESPTRATSVSFSAVPQGWCLSWTEQMGALQVFKAEVLEMDSAYQTRIQSVEFPASTLNLTKNQTPGLKISNSLIWGKVYGVSVPPHDFIYLKTATDSLIPIDNHLLRWDLYRNYVLGEDEILCLPCLKHFPESDLQEVASLPSGLEHVKSNAQFVKSRKIGDTIYWVKFVVLNKRADTGSTEKIDQLYLKTGKIAL